jgi:type IV pilus biogenesis protein CpaD/CtpE
MAPRAAPDTCGNWEENIQPIRIKENMKNRFCSVREFLKAASGNITSATKI